MMRWLRWLRWCWPLPPRCTTCAGKGWLSPEDSDREIEKSWEWFMAGYQHAQDTAAEVKLSEDV
jgi:hypothetical protein